MDVCSQNTMVNYISNQSQVVHDESNLYLNAITENYQAKCIIEEEVGEGGGGSGRISHLSCCLFLCMSRSFFIYRRRSSLYRLQNIAAP